MRKNLPITALFFLAFLSISTLVLAQEDAAVMGIFSGFFVFIVLLVLIQLVLQIWMLVDCIKRDFENKVLWVIIILLTGLIGPILYYFLVKRKNA